MTDYEISRRLALAIGWPEARIVDGHNTPRVIDDAGWVRYFNYTEPAVIWPIAERFNCFPKKWHPEWRSELYVRRLPKDMHAIAYADTAARATALAVIKAKEQP